MLNMDFHKPVTIQTLQQQWVASPMPGVWRKPLAREDMEKGHATSIVRYDPGASFSPHGHPKGEEILVLEGTFSDESGDYQAGTYFRNPEGFSHAPFSKEGCVILVKLYQFQSEDRTHSCIDTDSAQWINIGSGLFRLPLHHFQNEQVEMIRSSEDAVLNLADARLGVELYIIAGCLADEEGVYSEGCWIRKPARGDQTFKIMAGSKVWIKSNHLFNQ